MISKHYSGTGSTHTSASRRGKGSLIALLDHGSKTIRRFYKGNIEDYYKQQIIDLVIGFK